MRNPLARYALGLSLLAIAAPVGADIGSTPIQGWQFSRGSVLQARRAGRTLYVAGAFDAVAPASGAMGGFGRLDVTGVPVLLGPRLDGSGTAVVDDGAGGYFVARLARPSPSGPLQYLLDHVRADGSLDAAFHPVFNGAITTLTRLGTTLYAGGYFFTVNGASRGMGAAFDLATGALLPWDPRVANGGVLAISAGGLGRVYIGGSFSSVAGQSVGGLVRVSATTGGIDTAIDTSISAGGAVNALVTINNVLYVGGRFNAIENLPRQHLAALDLTTQGLTSFVADVADGQVLALRGYGTRLFVAGSFTALGGGVRRSGVAQLHAATGVVTSWKVTVDRGVVTALAVVGDAVYLGGSFTRVNGERRAHVAAADASDAAGLMPWNPGITDAPAALAGGADGEVAVVGDDLVAGARTRDGLAAFDLVTHELLSFAPVLDVAMVQALEATDTAVYFGGTFASVNGKLRRSLAATDPDGHLLPWSPGDAATVASVILASGPTVYVGGQFTTLGGQPRLNLGAVDAQTGAADTRRFDTNAAVRLLQLSGSTLYAGGSFTTAGGQPREDVAAFDTTTGAVMPLRLVFDNHSLLDMRVVGSLLYVGGSFTAVGGQARTHAAAVDRVTGAVAPFAPALDGLVYRLSDRGGAVYLVGRFTSVNGVPRAGQAAVAAGAGAATLPFDPALAGTTGWSALDGGSTVLFGTASAPRPAMYLWPDSPAGVAPAAPGAPRVRVSGSTLSVTWDRALLGASPTGYVLEASTSPGSAPFAAVPVGAAASFTTGGVPPGLYYLRVRAIAAGGTSLPSPSVGVTVGVAGCTAPPASPAATASTIAGAAALQWDTVPGPAASHTLVAGTSPGAANLGAVPLGGAMSFTTPAPPGVYFARVLASSPCGVSAPSADVPIVVDVATPPVAPSVIAQVSGNTVSIAWTAVPGALGYRFEAGSGPLQRDLASVSTPSTSLVAGGVPPGTYYVRVIAVGASGESLRPDEVVVIVR